MNASEITTETAALPQIDLNRDRREERRQVLRRSRRHAAAVLAIIVTAGAVLAPLTLQAMALHRELRKTRVQAKKERASLQSVTAANAQLDEQISLWERLEQTQQSRRAWSAAFPSLTACLPQDVFLQQIQITGQDKDIEIQLQGAARTMTGLRAFTRSLQGSPVFAHVHLDEATTDNAKAKAQTARSSGLTFRLAGPITIGAASDAP